MQKVQRKVFLNASDEEINEFLNDLPAENIVSTHFTVYGYQNAADEWTTIFYKSDRGNDSQIPKWDAFECDCGLGYAIRQVPGDEIEEPACPHCGGTNSTLIGEDE